jgi:hypothetical protein
VIARWRVPIVLSAAVLLAQLFAVPPLLDVVSGAPPVGVHLAWPVSHVLLAPFTLLADWMNAGSRDEIVASPVWLIVAYVAWRAVRRPANPGRGMLRTEALAAASLLLAAALFLWWGVRFNRPIPHLETADPSLIVVDVHSHTSASHDGRAGFGAAQNARWHFRAGFDAAFVTDHNVAGAARAWRRDRAGHPPRLLPGEELSLAGLHLVVLGADSQIRNTPWNASFDSTLALIALLSSSDSTGTAPYLIASLPEFREYHWGPDMGSLVRAGVGGFEVWTTSPRAMQLRPGDRATLIARAHLERRALFGATDMHGLGNTAAVWNVVGLPGWRALDDAALSRALLAAFRARPDRVGVVAMRRFVPASPLGRVFAVPIGIGMALRTASPWHAVSLLGWLWLVAVAGDRRRQDLR